MSRNQARIPERVPEIEHPLFGLVYRTEEFSNIASHMEDYLMKARVIAEDTKVKGGNILDICCGSGTFTMALAACFPHSIIKGVDNDPDAISIAREFYENSPFLEFDVGDAYNFADKYNQLSLITIACSLHHLNDLERFAGQVQIALNPGGHLVIHDYDRRRLQTVIDSDHLVAEACKRRNEMSDNELMESITSRRQTHLGLLGIARAHSIMAAYTPLEVQTALNAHGIDAKLDTETDTGFLMYARKR